MEDLLFNNSDAVLSSLQTLTSSIFASEKEPGVLWSAPIEIQSFVDPDPFPENDVGPATNEPSI